MFKDNYAFSGFSVNDLAAAEKFYSDILGLDVNNGEMGMQITLGGGTTVFVYQKDDHQPATYTMLNFNVDDIDEAVDSLAAKGVSFLKYAGMTDQKGIARGISANRGPDIAWFTDPAGNILSVIQEDEE
jgi:predicted enzyme related to lactoylglutathione lyase